MSGFSVSGSVRLSVRGSVSGTVRGSVNGIRSVAGV